MQQTGWTRYLLPLLLGAVSLGSVARWSASVASDSGLGATPDLGRRTELWAARPLAFATAYDPDAMRLFVEGRRALTDEIGRIQQVRPSADSALDDLRRAVDATGMAGVALSQSPIGAEQEAAAAELLVQAESLRSAVTRVERELRDARASELAAAERGRRLRVLGGVFGAATSLIWFGWLVLVDRRRTRRWAGDVVRIAMEATVHGEPPGEAPETADLQLVRTRVAELSQRLRDQTRSTEFQIRRQHMLRDFTEALETSDNESEVLDLFVRTLGRRHPTLRPQVLLADEADHQLRPVLAEEPGCSTCQPQDPSRCKALRMGRALRVGDPSSVAGCLRMKHTTPRPYVCVPLSDAGRAVAVVRLVSQEGALEPETVVDITTVAQRFNVRLGVLRLLAQAERLARTDALTGLPNRRVLDAHLDMLLDTELPSSAPIVAVLAIDLDRFKQLNDSHGHAAGDAALRAFGLATAPLVPEDGCLGRTGGEEFILCVPVRDPAAGMALADKVVAANRDLVASSPTPCATVSIGVAFAPSDGSRPKDVLRVADRRLYAAKDAGRDRAVGPDRLTGPLACLDGDASLV